MNNPGDKFNDINHEYNVIKFNYIWYPVDASWGSDISLMILLYLSKTIFSYTLFEAFEGYWLLKVVTWGNL